MWKAIKDEIARDVKGLLALLGILFLISIPGWGVLGFLYFLNQFCKALGIDVQ
jgi:hypothetical protein